MYLLLAGAGASVDTSFQMSNPEESAGGFMDEEDKDRHPARLRPGNDRGSLRDGVELEAEVGFELGLMQS